MGLIWRCFLLLSKCLCLVVNVYNFLFDWKRNLLREMSFLNIDQNYDVRKIFIVK